MNLTKEIHFLIIIILYKNTLNKFIVSVIVASIGISRRKRIEC